MKILLINHYAGNQELGMEFRPYYMAREWKKLGHEVHIVASSFSHLRKSAKVRDRFTVVERDGVIYNWIKTPEYKGNGIKRVINIFAFVFSLFLFSRRILKEFKPDIVIASSTYPLDIYPAKYLSWRSNAQLIFEVHDLWPLSPMELGNFSRYHPYIMLLQAAENYAYRNANTVISMLPCAKEHMLLHGMNEQKYCHIPNGIVKENWIYSPELLPNEHFDLLSGLKANDIFVFGYAGGHAISNSLDTLVEAASLCQDKKVAFVLVGKGSEKANLIELTETLGLKNIYFLPAIEKDAIPALLDLFDCTVITWNRSSLYRFGVSPNKVFDYMMSSKPIIQAIEAGNDLVKDSGAGLSVPPRKPESLAQAFVEMFELSEKERVILGGLGRNYVIKHHDYVQLASNFIDVVNQHQNDR